VLYAALFACRKAFLRNAAKPFYRASNLLDRTVAVAARQTYITGSAVVSTRSSLSILPIPPLILQRVKKCGIWPRSWTPVYFEPSSFQNKATHRQQSIVFGAAMMSFVLHKFGSIWSRLASSNLVKIIPEPNVTRDTCSIGH